MGELEATEEAGILARGHVDRLSAGREGAHNRHRVAAVRTKNGERIAVPPIDEGLHGVCADPDETILTDSHERRAPVLRRLAAAAKPRSGMASQFGRLAAS